MRPATALLAVSCLFLVGCGGSDESTKEGAPGGGKTLEQLWRAPGDDVAILPGTSEHVPGDVRVSFVVVDAEGRPVLLPTAKVWLATGLDAKPFLETDAKLERIGVPGGAQADSTHIYVAHLRVRKPGTYWLVAAPEGGEKVQAIGNLEVVRKGTAPLVGDAAPASVTPTLAGAEGHAARITTRVPPDDSLLRSSVRDALRAHAPFVVTFATPKFCESRTCGPVVDVVEEVARRSEGSRVRFIHAEVYEDNDPAKGYARWMQEWHLRTEPWTFVVDSRGKIAGRFEGPVSVAELEDAVRPLANS
jgi:hypothetical protein